MKFVSKLLLALVTIFSVGFFHSNVYAAKDCENFENDTAGRWGTGSGVLDIPPASGTSFTYFSYVAGSETSDLKAVKPAGTSNWEYFELSSANFNGTYLFFEDELIVTFPDNGTTSVEFTFLTFTSNPDVYVSWDGGATWSLEPPGSDPDQGEKYTMSFTAPKPQSAGSTIRIEGVDQEIGVTKICVSHFNFGS